MNCPKCNAALPEDANFCIRCGQRIPRCASCGRLITKDTRFCAYDGTPVPEGILSLFQQIGADALKEEPEQREERPVETESAGHPAPEPEEGEPVPRSEEGEQPPAAAEPPQPEEGESAPRSEEEGEQPPADAEPSQPEPEEGEPAPEPPDGASQGEERRKREPEPEWVETHSCIACGRQFEGEGLFCPECQLRLTGEPKIVGEPPAVPGREEKKPKLDIPMKLLLALAAMLLLLCVVFAVVSAVQALASRKAGEEPNRTSIQPVEQGGERLADAQPDGESPEEADAPVTEQLPADTPAQPETEEQTPEELQSGEEQAVQDALTLFVNECDSRLFSKEDIEGFDQRACRLARNAIYAHCGWSFQSGELRDYYEQFSWYRPTVSSENFDEGVLSAVETANLDLIVSYETEMGYRVG